MQGKPKPSNKERCTLSVKFANSSSRLKAYQSFLSSLNLKPDMDVGKTQTNVNVLFAANRTWYEMVHVFKLLSRCVHKSLSR